MNKFAVSSPRTFRLKEDKSEEILQPDFDGLLKAYNFLDMMKIIPKSRYALIDKEIISVHCGGNVYGHPRVHVDVTFKYSESGWEDMEGNPTKVDVTRVAEMDFRGDGVIYVRTQIYDDIYFEMSFDDHNWSIEDKDCILNDLIDKFAAAYQKAADEYFEAKAAAKEDDEWLWKTSFGW